MPVIAARKWLLTVLLILYAGGAVASVSVPCHLLSAAQQSTNTVQVDSLADGPEVDLMGTQTGHHHHAPAMDHSAHEASAAHSADSADQDQTQHDCCDMANHCLSASCTLPWLDGRLHLSSLLRDVSTLPAPDSNIPPDPSYSLYRPPIRG